MSANMLVYWELTERVGAPARFADLGNAQLELSVASLSIDDFGTEKSNAKLRTRLGR